MSDESKEATVAADGAGEVPDETLHRIRIRSGLLCGILA